MIKLASSLLFLVAVSSLAVAQGLEDQCHRCSKSPFQPNPPCFDYCAVNILAGSDQWELRVIFNLSQKTAQEVSERRLSRLGPNTPPPSITDFYLGVLSESETT